MVLKNDLKSGYCIYDYFLKVSSQAKGMEITQPTLQPQDHQRHCEAWQKDKCLGCVLGEWCGQFACRCGQYGQVSVPILPIFYLEKQSF